MSNKKITDLTELTTPTTDDVFPVVDIATNTTQKVQLGNLPTTPAVTSALASKQATLVSGTNIKTINGASVLGSGDIVTPYTPPSGVSGAIQFSNGSAFASDAANLFWDDTNNRLGVGTNAPTQTLDVNGVSNFRDTVRIGVSGRGGSVTWGGGFFMLNSSGTDGSSLAISDTKIVNVIPGSLNTMINTTTDLGAKLGIRGSGSTSATTSLLVQNSGGSVAFQVKDNQQVQINFGNTLASAATPNLTFSSSQTGVFSPNPNQLGIACYGNETARFIYGNSLHNGALNIGKFANPDNNAFFGWCSDGSLEITGNAQSVFVNPTNNSSMVIGASTAQATAILQADSTTKGFLPPRMTTTQKNAIASPASGLQVYDTTLNQMSYYNGSSWVNI